MSGSSCYILELAVGAGGSPRGDVYIYNRLEHIRSILEQDLTPAERPVPWMGASFVLAGGQEMRLWTIEGGIVTSVVDLRRFVRARRGANGRAVPLDDEAFAATLGVEESFDVPDDLRFEIDWPAITALVPATLADPLRPGQTIELSANHARFDECDSYLAGRLPYGYSDLANEDDPDPAWIDPDPAPSDDP